MKSFDRKIVRRILSFATNKFLTLFSHFVEIENRSSYRSSNNSKKEKRKIHNIKYRSNRVFIRSITILKILNQSTLSQNPQSIVRVTIFPHSRSPLNESTLESILVITILVIDLIQSARSRPRSNRLSERGRKGEGREHIFTHGEHPGLSNLKGKHICSPLEKFLAIDVRKE